MHSHPSLGKAGTALLKLLTKIDSPEQPSVSLRPVFVRLPRSSTRCALTGLSRSVLCNLILPTEANGFRPPVRSKVLKQPGASRGCRLIEVDSLLSYLNGLGDGGAFPKDISTGGVS